MFFHSIVESEVFITAFTGCTANQLRQKLVTFTEKGINAFTKYFGKEALEKMGKPFENFTHDMILF